MAENKNGDGNWPSMVSGGNPILWQPGIRQGKDIGGEYYGEDMQTGKSCIGCYP